jgi:UDP:flavonoid glycosyltransferase YjiC (YdhE family)
MQFLVVVQGSYGDLNPCLAIALGLRERGHHVLFITTEFYAPLMNRLGLEFVSILSRQEHLRISSHPDFNHPFRSFGFTARELLVGLMRAEYQAIAERYDPGRTVVLALGLPLGARIAHEKLGVPMATLAHFPPWMRSVYGPHGLSGRKAPPLLRKFLRHLFDLRMNALVAPEISRFRSELNLPPIRRLYVDWLYSPQMILGLFPDWYASPQPDWPPNVSLTGFPIFDGGEAKKLQPEIEDFLRAGDPPLVINALSGYHSARQFFEISVAAVRRLGRRAILLSQFSENVPPGLPAEIRHFGYVPHTLLLPRTAGIVHQGGIGTTAKAMLARIPQLIVPVNFDQPYNARCVTTLGVGAMLRPRQYQPDRLVRELESLLGSSSVAERLQAYGAQIEMQDGVAEACQRLAHVFCEERQALGSRK